MILIRYILICIIGYLLVRAFFKINDDPHNSSVKDKPEDSSNPPKKISKEIGEYVDYEEIKKEKEKQR